MQSLNVLLLGNSTLLEKIQQSKFLKKLYVTFDCNIKNVVVLQYNAAEDLIPKCKALKIDIVIAEDETLVYSGIVDKLRKERINCIALNSKWAKLVNDSKYSKKLLTKYGIPTPENLAFPQEYPLVLRLGRTCRIVNSLEEMIQIKEIEIPEDFIKDIFLEKFLEGEKFNLTTLFDGKNLFFYANPELTRLPEFTDLKTKLQNMFTQENIDYTGFLNAKLIHANNKLFILGFNTSLCIDSYKKDLLFLIQAVIYQKLDEI